jgi:hypothetical protein
MRADRIDGEDLAAHVEERHGLVERAHDHHPGPGRQVGEPRHLGEVRHGTNPFRPERPPPTISVNEGVARVLFVFDERLHLSEQLGCRRKAVFLRVLTSLLQDFLFAGPADYMLAIAGGVNFVAIDDLAHMNTSVWA